MAKIDVLLPVKNGIDFLAESLDSIKDQTFRDWRVLILDHGSTDGSRELALQYQERDPRFELHSFPEAKGLAGLLNCGLDLCDCDYVMRHDADDVCLADRMAIVLAAFEAEPGCIAIGGQCDMIDGAGAPIGKMTVPVGSKRVAAASFFRNPIAHPAAMLDFRQVQQLGIRYGVDFLKVLPEHKRIEVHSLAEDYYMFGQLSILGKCSNVPQTLIRYRSHGGNVSMTKFEAQMEASMMISRSLARSFCAMHGLPWFDPAPFCNHGGTLVDVGRTNFSAEFAAMAASLRKGLGESPELERELEFRRTVSNRNEAFLLWRYNKFRARNLPETGEWNAIRSWLIRRLPGKQRMSVQLEMAA